LTGSISTSSNGCCPNTTSAAAVGPTRRIRCWSTRSSGPAGTRTRRKRADSSCAAASSRARTPADPGYRRFRHVRYADDWLLGFAGPKREAEDNKSKIAAFLRKELKLELSQSKTLITHAASQAARFLGYEIRAQHSDTKITCNRRAVNGAIGLFVPRTVIRQRCALYMSKGKPAQRGMLLHDDDFTIVAKYQAEYAGLVQYHLLAQDVFRLGRLHWVMETSLLKALAGKHRSTVTAMARKYKTTTETPAGPRRCLQVTVERDRGRKPLVTRFGGIPLRRLRTAVLTDQRPVMASARRNELIHRLLAGRCELCEDTVNLEVHHVRTLADLSKPGRREKPAWMHLMAMRRRKTLVTCRHCHEDIHAGRATKPYPKLITGEQGAGKLASPVREETDGKGPGQGHLAGRRLHSAGGLGKRNAAKASTRPSPTQLIYRQH
jgi:Type II intron maturase